MIGMLIAIFRARFTAESCNVFDWCSLNLMRIYGQINIMIMRSCLKKRFRGKEHADKKKKGLKSNFQ